LWVAAAIAVAGCGSPPLSVTQLQGGATHICRVAAVLGNRIRNPASPSASGAFLRSGAAVLRYELTNLRALRPPASLASQYSSTLEGFARQLSLVQNSVRELAIGADPVVTVKALQEQLGPIESQQDSDWESLGIPACTSQ
jgi:hypothetical protein